MIGASVHIYMFVDQSYFSDRLTFSSIRNRTCRRIYRLAPPLRTPETLSSLSKSRISIDAHLALFVRRMTSHNSIDDFAIFGIFLGTESRHWQTRQQVESLKNWERSECDELCLRRGSPLACGVMCSVSCFFSATE